MLGNLSESCHSVNFVKAIVVNPLTTGVENECWLQGWNNFWLVQKWVLTTGMEQKMRRLQNNRSF